MWCIQSTGHTGHPSPQHGVGFSGRNQFRYSGWVSLGVTVYVNARKIRCKRIRVIINMGEENKTIINFLRDLLLEIFDVEDHFLAKYKM